MPAGSNAINVIMPYSGDANGDNGYSVEYRLSSDNLWLSWVSNAGHVANAYATTISGRTPGASYDVRVTYHDNNGVGAGVRRPLSFPTAQAKTR